MNRRRAAERAAVREPARQERCSRKTQYFRTRERERDVRRADDHPSASPVHGKHLTKETDRGRINTDRGLV
jgi:hypothetical protein